MRASGELDRKALKRAERIVAGHPSSPPALSELARAYFEKARGIREKLVAMNPADRTEVMYLGALYARIASVLQALGDSEGSPAAYLQVIGIDERLVHGGPSQCVVPQASGNLSSFALA